MIRRGGIKLGDPRLAHGSETMRILGMTTARERSLADERLRRVDPPRPLKKITGDRKSGDAFANMLRVMQRNGELLDLTEEGGRYGDILYNAILVDPVTPIFVPYSAISADTGSTTNTATTVVAGARTITLPDGVWSLLTKADMEMQRSVTGSSRFAIEVAGAEALSGAFLLPFTSGTGLTPSTVWARKAYALLSEEVEGGGDVTVRVRYRNETSGTTSAQNPTFITYCWRTA